MKEWQLLQSSDYLRRIAERLICQRAYQRKLQLLSQGRAGSVSTEALRQIQKKWVLQKEKAEVQLQGLGAGLQLDLSQMGTGTRGEKHSHAGRHPPPPGWEKIGDVSTLETPYFYFVILYQLEKEKVVFLHWEQEGQQRNVR